MCQPGLRAGQSNPKIEWRDDLAVIVRLSAGLNAPRSPWRRWVQAPGRALETRFGPISSPVHQLGRPDKSADARALTRAFHRLPLPQTTFSFCCTAWLTFHVAIA